MGAVKRMLEDLEDKVWSNTATQEEYDAWVSAFGILTDEDLDRMAEIELKR